MRAGPAITLFIALAALVASARETAAGEHPWNEKRIYYVMEYNGRLQEKGFFVRRPGSYERQPCVITEEEKYTYAPYDNQTPIRAVRIKTVTTPRGEALQRHEEAFLGDSGHQLITVTGGMAVFEASGSFGGAAQAPAPPGALFEVSGEWLAALPLRVGDSRAVSIIDRVGRDILTETVDIRQRLSEGDARQPSVWLAEFNSSGRPPMYARFTSDGRLTRLESEGLVYQVVTRDEYERGAIPAIPAPEYAGEAPYPGAGGYLGAGRSGTPVIYIGEVVPAWDNFAWLILQALPPVEWNNAIAASDYAQIEYTGSSTNIAALRNAPRVDASAQFPMAVPPEIQPYLSATDLLPSLNQVIIETARAAVTDHDTRSEERNVLRAVSYLAGWIHQNIEVGEWSGGRALDALANRAGDALGHARLFAAMARSLGIPSRVCQGFLTHTGQARYHCWAEAWLNGIWIPVDTTVSRVGLPAGYVMAERSGPDGELLSPFADFMRTPDLSLTLLSGGRETPTGQMAVLRVGDRRTYAVSEGDWLANLYWGFALRLPPAWTGSAKLNSVEIASPDLQASIKCEALAGDYGAGNAELESNIASLRSNLQRFRVVDSRVVAFDSEGATPALFIDFTCVQNGANLRCRQYLLPRRQRAFRISFWAPSDSFTGYTAAFDSILASFEF